MSKLRRNIAVNIAGNAAVAVFSLIGVKFVFAGLGADALGLIYFTLATVGAVAAVLEMGIYSTAIREVAANRTSDPAYVRRLVQSGTLIYGMAFLFAAVVFYFAAPLIVARWIKLSSTEPALGIYALRVLGIGALTVLPQRFFASVCRGLEQLHLNNSIDVFSLVLQQAGVIVLVHYNVGLAGLSIWFALSFFVPLFLYAGAVARELSPASLIPHFSADVLKRNLAYSRGMMSVSLLGMLFSQGDKLLLAKLLPIGIVGNYTFTYYVLQRASVLTDAVVHASLPAFARVSAQETNEAVVRQFGKVLALVTIGSTLVFSVFAFFLPGVLAILLNPEVARQLILTSGLLALGFYMHAVVYVPHIVAVALGKPGIAIASNLWALIFVVPITVFLIVTYGAAGAAMGWVVYHIFGIGYVFPRVCRDCLGIPWRRWLLHSAAPMLAVAFVYLIIFRAGLFYAAHSWLALTLVWLVTAPAAVAVAYSTLPAEAKHWARESVRHPLSLLRLPATSTL